VRHRVPPGFKRTLLKAKTVTKKSYISIFRKLKYTKTRQEKGKDVFVFIFLTYASYGSDLGHSGI
jgi:hypothetical protein